MRDHDRRLMECRCHIQFTEAFGPTNRWFCSEYHGKKIEDRETLLTYYIKSGGAEDFAQRFEQAMGEKNRWFCAEFYGREINDPEILWEYYIEHAAANSCLSNTRCLAECL